MYFRRKDLIKTSCYPRFLKPKGVKILIWLSCRKDRCELWIIYRSLTGRIGFQPSPLLSLRAGIAVCSQRGEDQRGRRTGDEMMLSWTEYLSFWVARNYEKGHFIFIAIYIDKFSMDLFFSYTVTLKLEIIHYEIKSYRTQTNI